ncbi:MAG: ExeA family protein [Vicinamibacterales bacterium]
MSSQPGYEAFFGFLERPFSLTPDPRYSFRSRSYGRAFDTLLHGVARKEGLLLLTGDLGVGKTTLCRTLVEKRDQTLDAVFVANGLVAPHHLLRLMLQELGAVATPEDRSALSGATHAELHQHFDDALVALESRNRGVLLIVDEAQTLPAATVDAIESLLRRGIDGEHGLRILLAAQPSASGAPALHRSLEERVAVRARLLPFDRDECARYIEHRLITAGGGASAIFSNRALEVIYALSGGLPRLVNLICERALRECAATGAHRIDPPLVETAASALELQRPRLKRFRWYSRRAS